MTAFRAPDGARGGLARADYREYGEIAFYETITVNGGYRQIAPQLVYTNHDYDAVLGLYYAKARFYDPEDKHFLSMDPVKGEIINPLSLTPYVYCVDNPLRWTDPLGEMVYTIGDTMIKTITSPNNSINTKLAKLDDLVLAYGFSKLTYNQGTNRYRSSCYSGSRIDTYVEYQPGSGVKIVQSGDRTGRNSRTIPLIGQSRYGSNAPLTSYAEYINGNAYVDIDYFHQLMCEMGYNYTLAVADFTQDTRYERIQKKAASMNVEQFKKDFVLEVFPIFLMYEFETGIPAEVMFAQMCIESAYGSARPIDKYTGQDSYNYFGIKGEGPAGHVAADTWEQYPSGEKYTIVADFAAYHNKEEAIGEFVNLLVRRYTQYLESDGSITDWAHAIAKGGYATALNYEDTILSVIKTWGLDIS